MHPLAVACLRAHGNALVAAGRAAEGQAQLERALQGRIRLAGTQVGAGVGGCCGGVREHTAGDPQNLQ